MFQLTPFGLRSSHTLNDFRNEIESLFNRFETPAVAGDGDPYFAPSADLVEDDSAYELSLDVPAMKPEDFEVELKDGQLWVSGERKAETEEKGKTYHRIERSYGKFRRVVKLGSDVDAGKVEAEYKDGVLRVRVPKTEAATPKRIEVKS